MPDYSISLGEMLAGRSPPGTTFEQQYVRSAAIAIVGEHLKEHHCCYVAGRPRSGKTTIALYVGWEVIQGRHRPRYQARYLDLANFAPPREDSACFPETCYGKEWLLIVDNWHSRPDCHQILEREFDRHWHRGFSTIFCATRFSADGAGADLPSLGAFRDKPMPIVDAEESVAQVARGMIDARFRVQVGRLSPDVRASAHVPNDEDRAQALVAPSNHKKVRGNLRFLRWRLEAWHPELAPLREVGVEDVLQHFRREVTQHTSPHQGTLESIAAIAQWELPYERRAGDPQPPGIERLEQQGLAVPVVGGCSWRMDATDAYLLLLANPHESWRDATERLLLSYIKDRRDSVYAIVRSLLEQAHPDHRLILLLKLLEDADRCAGVRKALLEGIPTHTVSPGQVFKLVNHLFVNFPQEPGEAVRRLEVLDRLLPAELGKGLGHQMSHRGIYVIARTLNHLRRDADRFRPFVNNLVEGFGIDNLRDKLEASSSGNTQRAVLNSLKKFDESLAADIRRQIKLHPEHTKCTELEILVATLYKGILCTNLDRLGVIDTLKGIDEGDLRESIPSCACPAETLQKLLQAALWLSESEARRLAGIFSDLLPEMPGRGGARPWSYLINNIHAADPASADDLVDFVLARPAGKYLHSSPKAGGALLANMEKVQPGCTAGWIADDETCLQHIFSLEHLDSYGFRGQINDLLVPLSVFAGPSMVRFASSYSVGDFNRLTEGLPVFQSHVLRGALRIAGVDPDLVVSPGPGSAELPKGFPGIQALAGLFDLNQLHVAGTPCEFIHLCTDIQRLPNTALLAMTNLPWAWSTDDVCASIRRILRGSMPERTRVLEHVIMATHLLGGLHWRSGYTLDPAKQGHRGIQTAIHEKILHYKIDNRTDTVVANLNRRHPIVQTTSRRLEQVLGALDHNSRNATEWLIAVPSEMSTFEIDTWRSRLIRAGAARTEIVVNEGRLEITFTRGETSPSVLYEGLDLGDAGGLS